MIKRLKDFTKTWNLYAGNVKLLKDSLWLDDFKDVHREYFISQKYESLYGGEFVEAQKIVEKQLIR